MIFKHPTFHLLPLLSFLFLLSCTGNEAKKSKSVATSATDSTLRIALLPTLDNLPFYYADSEGIFDSLGIKVALQTYSAAMDADTAFLGTTANIIVTDLVKAQIWASKGDSLTNIMSTQLNLHLVSAHSSRIKKLSSLKEKIFGITRNSSDDLVTDEILRHSNLQSTDLNKPQINNIRLRCLMVDQNQYDGAILPEPFASECEARGATRLTSTSKLKIPNLSAVLIRDSVAVKFSKDIPHLINAYNISVERLNKIISDTKANEISLIKYIPTKTCVEIPDSLVRYTTFSTAIASPNDTAAINLARRWCQGRKLIK